MDEMRTIEIPAELDDQVQRAADHWGLSRNEAFMEMARSYSEIADLDWEDLSRSIDEALDDAKNGRTVGGELVSAWLKTWGHPDYVCLQEFTTAWNAKQNAV